MGRAILITAILAASLITDASAQNTDADGAASTLISECGWTQAINQLPKTVKKSAGLHEEVRHMSIDQRAALDEILEHSFNPSIIFNTTLRSLRDKYDKARFDRMLQICRTPLVKKMIALELESESVNAVQDIPDQMAKLDLASIGKPRLMSFARLNKALKTSEFAAMIGARMQQAFMNAMQVGAPQEEQLDLVARSKLLADISPKITSDANYGTLANYIHTYRAATDAELAEYAKILESDTVQWFSGILFNAMQTALSAR